MLHGFFVCKAHPVTLENSFNPQTFPLNIYYVISTFHLFILLDEISIKSQLRTMNLFAPTRTCMEHLPLCTGINTHSGLYTLNGFHSVHLAVRWLAFLFPGLAALRLRWCETGCWELPVWAVFWSEDEWGGGDDTPASWRLRAVQVLPLIRTRKCTCSGRGRCLYDPYWPKPRCLCFQDRKAVEKWKVSNASRFEVYLFK